MGARIAAVLVLCCVLFAACDDKKPTVKSVEPAPAPASTSTAPTPTDTPFAAPQDSPTKADGIDKILVTVIENKSINQMKADAPKIWALAHQYGYATDFKALAHPSLPNYLAMADGSTHGINDDDDPSGHRITGPSVFGQTIAAGGTAAIMAEGMGEACKLGKSGGYVPRHVPWAYFVDERDLCQQNVTDAQDFDIAVAAGGLANVGMLIPDQCHNAHSCSLGQSDDWVTSQVDEAMTGPDWKSGRLVIVITADEDNRKTGNHVLTVVIHPSQHHHVVTKPLSIYSLHRLMAQIGKAQPQGKGAGAPDMAKAFGLTLAR